jgi:hypothetical protein
VQRIKAEGDYEAAKALFETYGVHFDPALRDEVVARVERLNMPSYTGFVQPRLTPVHAAGRTIVDVEISYPLDLTTQMLEYSGRGCRGQALPEGVHILDQRRTPAGGHRFQHLLDAGRQLQRVVGALHAGERHSIHEIGVPARRRQGEMRAVTPREQRQPFHAEGGAQRGEVVGALGGGQPRDIEAPAFAPGEARLDPVLEGTEHLGGIGWPVARQHRPRRADRIQRLRRSRAALIEGDHVGDRQQLAQDLRRHALDRPDARVARAAGEKDDRRARRPRGRRESHVAQRQLLAGIRCPARRNRESSLDPGRSNARRHQHHELRHELHHCRPPWLAS